MLPQDRALNIDASNAFQIGEIFKFVLQEKMELDSIKALPGPICRSGSNCWELEIYFFYPERLVQTVRKVNRCTVDVSDVVPDTHRLGRTCYPTEIHHETSATSVRCASWND